MSELLYNFRSYEWASPEYLWLGWLILLAAAWGPVRAVWGRRWGIPWIKVRSAKGEGRTKDKDKIKKSIWTYLLWLPGVLRVTGLVLLWIALLRPQTVLSSSEASVKALDIYLVLDVSGSMQADDLKPSRLAAAKETLKNFVKRQKGDRLGLVVFAGKAFTQCPLSLDSGIVEYFIDQVEVGTVGADGTALGDGLLTAVQRLIKEPGRNQVAVLATDGRNNTGADPMTAAKVAAAAGIKVYTIGMGRRGGADVVARDPWGRAVNYHLEEPDEALLTSIAQATGGEYFRATDSDSLEGVYRRISELERREVKVKSHRDATEHYFPFLIWGAVLLLVEAVLRLRIRLVV